MAPLDPGIVAKVQAKLAAGVPQRAIARALPISRGSVAAIARGEWHPRPAATAGGDPFRTVAPHRCGRCGAKINTAACIRCTSAGSIDQEQQPPPAA